MAQSNDIRDREYSKFVESPTRAGESATEVVATVLDGNPFAVPTDADAFTRECVGNDVLYKFRSGGLTGTVLKTVTIHYQSPQDPDMTGGEL